MKTNPISPVVPIACGGTGGHLFPGIAIAEELQARGDTPKLLVSDKAIDQAGLKSAPHLSAVVLPAGGLSRGRGCPCGPAFRKRSPSKLAPRLGSTRSGRSC